jgi:alpha-tubulin suppressor-like RCC1 family protein
MALMADGTVKSWGLNNYGQLGNGTITSSSTPAVVTGLGGAVKAIAVGGSHSLALLTDGTVKSWGYNSSGQLGDGATWNNSSVPVTVAGLVGVVAIAAGGNTSMALLADGSIKSWGNNAWGQLGNGNNFNSYSPVTVTGLGGTATKISAGNSQSLALLTNGTVKAWGNNEFGELGNGVTILRKPVTALNADNVAPSVTSFTVPATSTTVSVTGISIAASDNIAVTGYCLTESNSSAGCAWSSAKPTSFTFTTFGAKTLYAFAKDAAGNASSSATGSVTITNQTTPSAYPSGDIDGNGTFDITDVQRGLKGALGLITLTVDEKLRGDVAPLSGSKPAPDGAFNLGDVGVLLRKLVGSVTW